MTIPFTAHQRRAIDIAKRHLDTCVVAGPGSGKTTVLVEYYRRLVEAGVDPLRILAITFTEKAAGNMRKKVAEAFAENPPMRARLERAWTSTVHGFCARLLRENAIFAGVDPEFTVADERQSWRLQQQAIADVMESVFSERPQGMRSLLRGLGGGNLEESLLNAYDAMRGAGVSVTQLAMFPVPEHTTIEQVVWTIHQLRAAQPAGWTVNQREHLAEILEGCVRIVEASHQEGALPKLRAIAELSVNLQKLKRGNRTYDLVKELRDEKLKSVVYLLVQQHYQAERDLLLEIVARFDRQYRQLKRAAGVVDFADLEEFSVRLLEGNAGARERLREQFDHILMDEFQDTNGQQARLLELVRPPDRFYAVGDINQSIFGFRHAEPDVFRQYRETVKTGGRHLVELIDNFRSRPDILRAVETVLHEAEGIEPRSLVPGRTFEHEQRVSVEVMAALAADADTALDYEARWVAQRILELTSGEHAVAFQEVAVLVRNTEVLTEFTRAFEAAGIPHVVNRGRGFYTTREVKDLTHLLRVIANPRDEISLAAVLRSPFVAASDEAILSLRILGDNIGVSLARLGAEHASSFDAEDLRRLIRFRTRLHQWRLRREYHGFDRLLLDAVDECGYAAEERSNATVEKFLAHARAAAASGSLEDFVRELEVVRDEDPREPDSPPEDSSNTVKVMTVHSAKGLEFPIVFVCALHKGIETKLAAVEFSRHHGLGATWINPADGKAHNDLHQHAIRDERKHREKEESHRLLYVAMTRAEQRLFLTWSVSDRKPKNWAATVADALGLTLDAACDREVTRTAPNGKEWTLRVFASADPPPAPVRASAAPDAPTMKLVEPPPTPAQYENNATVTDVSEFAACPRRYYLGRYLGFDGRARAHVGGPEEGATLSASEFGTQVHAILACNPPSEPDAEAVALAAAFQQTPLARRIARATRVEREADFLMAVGDMVLRGQIDLWFEEDGELLLVDYKTDDVTPREAHERAADYVIQLRLYALALDQLAGRSPDRAYLCFLRPGTAVSVDLTPSLLESPEQVVADLLDAQQRLEFPLREAAHCRRCPFHHGLCPAQ